MRAVAQAAVVVADRQVRVVILEVGDVRDRVDETHRAMKIFERPFALQFATIR